MDDLYNRLKAFCDERGVSLARMCAEAGIPKSTPTELKMGRSKGLSTPSAQKIAAYLGITVDELLGNEEDSKIKLTSDQRSEILGIFENKIKEMNITEGLALARSKVRNNIFNQLRNWRHAGISRNDLIAVAQYLGASNDIDTYIADINEKAPAAVSDEDIKVALFGGDTEVTDEMWHEVMNYAEFLKQKYGKS